MADSINIPKKEDQLLFAVDIVSYFFRKRCSDRIHELSSLTEVSKAEGYRKTAVFSFNENVEYALDAIDESEAIIVHQEFLEMSSDSTVNRISCLTFLQYCKNSEDCFLFEGMEPGKILQYCARLASMACHFFTHDVPEVLPLAINTIKSALSDTNMYILACEYAESKSSQALRDQADLFTSESEENRNDSTPMSEDSHLQPVLKREASISETSSTGVESVTAGINRLRVTSVGSACASSSYYSPSSEAEASISNPVKTSDVITKENVGDFPPMNADQLMFATDIIFFFFRRQCNDMTEDLFKLDLINKIGLYRQTARVKLNYKVENMLDMIKQTQTVLLRREFLELLKTGRVNKETFTEYCSTCGDCFLFEGMQPKQLLIYCARVASMACYFFRHNVPEAVPMAIEVMAFNLSEESMSSLTGDRTESVGDYAICARSSTSNYSPTSEGDEVGVPNPAEIRAALTSIVNKDNVVDLPSTSTAGESPRLGKCDCPDKDENVHDSKILEPESAGETFLSGGGKHQEMN